MARSIKLESRSGYTFDVQVTKNLGRVVLHAGWKSFVRAHDLKMGDFLVFKYVGASQMKVLIFDISGCEKVPLYHVPKNAGQGGEERRGKTTDAFSSCRDPLMKSLTSDKRSLKQRGTSRQTDDHRVHSVPSYILQHGTHLTGVQMKKLKEKVRAIRSAIPIYACVIKKSCISGKNRAMNISGDYADVYLPFHEGTLVLQHHGKSWKVRCRVGQRECRYKRLLKGWNRFQLDNKLQLGDLCLFELLKTKKYTMKVHIMRAK
ncbi:hypothetical protein ACP70R_025029 [Stipagrostis hirtigluma subsp. patula]